MTITSNPATINVENIPNLDLPASTYNNGIFTSNEEWAIIKNRINFEPYKTVWNDIKTKANEALTAKLTGNVPTILDGTEPTGWDIHTIYSPDPADSHSDRTDYNNAQKIRDWSRALGFRYKIGKLNNEADINKYADTIIYIIKRWALDSATWMKPIYTCNNNITPTACNSYIEIMITMPGMLYGYYLTKDYSGWDTTNVLYGQTNTNTTVRTALKDWASRLLDKTKPLGVNPDAYNYRIYREASVCILAHVTERYSEIDIQLNDWLNNGLDYLSDTDGSILFERQRQDGRCPGCQTGCCGLSYSGSGIRSLSIVAEIARHRNQNFYTKTINNKNIKKCLDFHAPFYNKTDYWYKNVNPSTDGWKWCTMPMKCFVGQSSDIFELGWSFVEKKQIYKDAINRWTINIGKPRNVIEERFMGYVTLTHGNRL